LLDKNDSRNEYHRLIGEPFVNTPPDAGLGLGIQGTSPFVDKLDLGLVEKQAGE